MMESTALASAARHSAAPPSLRVLVLHQHYWPEIAATAQILTDLCEDLAALGHEVTVICGQPSYRHVGPRVPLPAYEARHGVAIRRVWSYTPKERTIPKRLVHYASYFATSLATTVASRPPDVCFIMSTPPLLLGVAGSLIRLLRGVPFVYSVQDLYPDIAVHLGVIKGGSVPALVIEHVAQTCYRAASGLVTLSPGMARRLAAKGVPETDIHVIPNWADTSAVKPQPRDNDFAREHRLAEGFVVQYSGNLGLSQSLDSILGAAERLRSLPITFALVGDGNAKSSLESAAHAKRLTNVRFLPPQPRERLSELLSACDVGLVPMKRGVGDDLVPSKLYGIMAAARPVLASVENTSEVARVVAQHQCGWVVAPESADALAAGIRTVFETSADERAKRGEHGRRACDELYSRRALTRRYEQVLRTAAHGASTEPQRRADSSWRFHG